MRALLDTNILIHREAGRVANRDIGNLFRWIDRVKYTKCVHPESIKEINKNPNKSTVEAFNIKLSSYEILRTTAPMAASVEAVGKKFDVNENDRIDTILLNELFNERVDLLITEDKKLHQKAKSIGLADKVFSIDALLEKIASENPELINYKVLNVQKKVIGEISIVDPFFDTLKEDYPGFDRWFNKKANEDCYVTIDGKRNVVLAFLYLKIEGKDEVYFDIQPVFPPKKRLKIGTFKVVSNGVRLGERFLKIIFDNALANKVDEIYVTIFDKRTEQQRLISLLEDWGFVKWGMKGGELVYVRNLTKRFDPNNPKLTYPFISKRASAFLVPIYPDYHTELLPDSYLKTELAENFSESEPHRNAISKVYISRSIERGIKKGDIIIFYRTAEKDKNAYYSSVITTIGIVEDKIDKIKNEDDFILKCRKRSVFSNEELKKYWNWSSRIRPFIINFLYVYSFRLGKRMTRKMLLDLGIIAGSENELRGLKPITKEQFELILKETGTDESIIVD